MNQSQTESKPTDDEELIKGLNYYKLNIGERILLPYHDPEERKRFIEDNI